MVLGRTGHCCDHPLDWGATNVNGEQPPCCTYQELPPCCTYQELHASRGKENERLTCSNQMILRFFNVLRSVWLKKGFGLRFRAQELQGLRVRFEDLGFKA